MQRRNAQSSPRPFLKWAGGKRQLLYKIIPLAPKDFSTYHEPFLGGGAVFFALAKERKDLVAKLSDTNEDLINSYRNVRNKTDELIEELSSIKKEFLASDDRRAFFNKTREEYNSTKDSFDRAKYLMFLNKTCFNGLYRVNSSNEFNVPFCDYKNPAIFDEENLRKTSELLNSIDVEFKVQDYQLAMRDCNKDDFCYLDPPYHAEKKTSFTSYTKDSFGAHDQINIFKMAEELSEKDVKIILSNSNSDLIRSLYSKTINRMSDEQKRKLGLTTFLIESRAWETPTTDNAKHYEIQTISATRSINSVGSKRKGSTELLITNY